MPERPSRRRFLTALGAVALAGCASAGTDGPPDGDDDAPDTDDSGPATTATGTDTLDPPASLDAGWPMPAYGPGRGNYTPESAGPTERPVELWRARAEGALSAPVVADGTLYVGGDGVVRAFDARTGAERWRTSVGTSTGPPRAMDGRLYVPTDEAVLALDAADGHSLWRVDAPGRQGFLVASHGVYYLSGATDSGTGDGATGGSDGSGGADTSRGSDTSGPDAEGGEARDDVSPALVALDSADGSERWRTGIRDPWTDTLFACEGRVFVSTGTHFPAPWVFDPGTGEFLGDERPDGGGYHFHDERFCLDGRIYGTDPFYGTVSARSVDGDLRTPDWRRSLDAAGDVGLAGGSDRLYVGAADGDRPGLHALSSADGESVWYVGAGEPTTRPAVARDAVVVRAGGKLRGFDPAEGTERWSRPIAGEDEAGGIALVDDMAYTTAGKTVRALRSR